MSVETLKAGKIALDIALARASKHAPAACIAAALVPLAMAVAPGAALADPTITSTFVAGTGGAENQFNYHIEGDGDAPVTELLIPEEQPGLFDLGNASTVLLGGTATEVADGSSTSGLNEKTALANGDTPAAYIDITGLNVYSGSVELFSASSSAGATLGIYEPSGGVYSAANGLTPSGTGGGGAAVPEPGSMALLGSALAGFAGLRRRRKA